MELIIFFTVLVVFDIASLRRGPTVMMALTALSGSGDNVGMDFTSAYAEHSIGNGSL